MIRAIACVSAIFFATLASAQTAALTDDEESVLAKVITMRLSGGEKWLLIASETASLRCDGKSMIEVGGCNGGMRMKEQSPEEIAAWLQLSFPTSSPGLIADFSTKAQHTANVKRPFPLQLQQVVRSPSGAVVAGGPMPQEAPDYIVITSRVGFDLKGREALAYIGAISPKNSKLSFGEYIYLRKDGENWSAAGRVRIWQM